MSFEKYVEMNTEVSLEQFLESVKSDGLLGLKLDESQFEDLLEAVTDGGYKKGDMNGSDSKEIKKLDTAMKAAAKSRATSMQYTKKSLLAIADKMELKVYVTFIKANGEERKGNFQIIPTDGQRTAKQDTIVVKEIGGSGAFRTIPLERLVSIQPF